MSEVQEFIRVNDRVFEIGECGFSIEPHVGREDHPFGGWRHLLSLYVEPVNDEFPHLTITDIDLYLRGRIPRELDGLRIRQSLDTGDYPTPWLSLGRWLFKKPWVRPGSTVGMASVMYEPPSCSNTAGKYDPQKHLFLRGELQLAIDRIDSTRWKVEVEVSHEKEMQSTGNGFEPVEDGIPAGSFAAQFTSNLEIESYD